MLNYIVKRLLQTIPTLLIISFLIFSLLYITPGDPVFLILGESGDGVSQEMYDLVREEYGLNDPFLVRYFNYIKGVLRGDLGKSYVTGQDVFSSIMERLPATLTLTAWALVFSLLISVPLGTMAALKHNTLLDSIATGLSTLGISLPRFWVGLMLMILFALKLGWLPSIGMADIEIDGTWAFIKSILMPAFSLSLGMAATQTRMIRSSMIDVLDKDYVRFARSKGIKEKAVIMSHAMRNAMIPVITVIGSEIGGLLGGAVVTEQIFSWPGIGRLAVNSIGRRDYPMIQGITLVICFNYLMINLLVDILYGFLNPQIRAGMTKQ